MRLKVVLLLCAAFSLAVLSSRFAAAVVFTPGSFRVSETGAGVYEVAIRVPPGAAGMEPKLSFVYNSQLGNGLLGMGWSLSGYRPSYAVRAPRPRTAPGRASTTTRTTASVWMDSGWW
ncbi:MAG: hypothetical protein IT529_13970 [Burkholderiales bacterium]|nr:hypothetical protein [Burkholderiales bacterium]